jgi:phenylpyruvate tautomerase
VQGSISTALYINNLEQRRSPLPRAGWRSNDRAMPLVNVFTSADAPTPDRSDALLSELSRLLAAELKKPESYVMTSLVPRTSMTFGGTKEPSCYVEVKNIGTMTPELTAKLSAALCARLSEALGVSSTRIYIEFAEARGHLWGHDGTTFG